MTRVTVRTNLEDRPLAHHEHCPSCDSPDVQPNYAVADNVKGNEQKCKSCNTKFWASDDIKATQDFNRTRPKYKYPERPPKRVVSTKKYFIMG